MIINEAKFLSSKILILASSSPRRQEILHILEIPFKVVPSQFEENLDSKSFDFPSSYVIATARKKAEEVLARLTSNSDTVDLVIGADTCVAFESEIMGKPKNRKNAIDMLTRLSGRSHEVVTGVCLKFRSEAEGEVWRTRQFHETTTVTLADLSLPLIEAYVDQGEGMDKAGGYGIQGLGGSLIQGINGDYYNVVGFPFHRFCTQLLPLIAEWKNSAVH